MENTTKIFDDLVATGGSDEHGPISSNTTTFSIGLFSPTDGLNTSKPLFYEYHYKAPSLAINPGSETNVGALNIYRIGSLTQVFTTWLTLVEAGEASWAAPVTKYIPELAQAVASNHDQTAVTQVAWEDVTLGDLAAHLACISTSGSMQGRTFEEMFQNLATQVGMSNSSLTAPSDITNAIIPSDVDISGWSTDYGDESPSIGMYSSIHDLSLAGIAILNSTLLPSAVTRRWLKPVSHTSNLRNAIGRPWIIFSATPGSPIDPRIEVFTNYGFIGQYSSYIGLTTDHNVGFVILAADSIKAPDLNAHADFIGEVMIPALEKAAIVQAGKNYAGSYSFSSSDASQNATMVIAKPDGMAGLSLANLTRGNEDLRASLARSLGVDPSTFSIRLYPTNSKPRMSGGRTQMAFRAVFQDEDALVDGGTPTCITWEAVDGVNYDGKARDLLIFTLNEDGAAESVSLPGWRLELLRQK
ncbi:hypothetical protein LTR84_004393 [Exophiala bonariae]|uniref:Beta-lactamase-related domain-containing protein n=1 Tax=Exophiala bonariae TaxID=1690606 RepID=A0AAV9N6S4_9EURO|nr:hypothetical protein LTR84_004393 [Exophiala bonariae]